VGAEVGGVGGEEEVGIVGRDGGGFAGGFEGGESVWVFVIREVGRWLERGEEGLRTLAVRVGVGR
jgi:hypothetical protein